MNASNFYSREVSIAPSHIVNPASYAPAQARSMTHTDIRNYRRWHREAALRARRAGFNIIYVYAATACLWRCISYKAATTIGRTSTAVAWSTECDCCVN